MIADERAAKLFLAELAGDDGAIMDRLEHLTLMLQDESRRQNLVSASSQQHVWQRHIADSAQLLRYVDAPNSWLDLGTGAGFPGLVIAAFRPRLAITLVEARGKRAEWLRHASIKLGLHAVNIEAHRAEDLVPSPHDAISARAFAPLERLLDLAHEFGTPSTRWLLPKGKGSADELASLQGWHHKFHVEQSLTDSASGIIVGTLKGRKVVRDNAGHC